MKSDKNTFNTNTIWRELMDDAFQLMDGQLLTNHQSKFPILLLNL